MIFSHTQDQLDLRDGARDYFRGRCTPEALRGLVEKDLCALGNWGELIEIGLPSFMANEASGGLAMNASAFALIAEEAGYVALPEPLVEVGGISVPVLSAVASDKADTLLQQLSAGDQRILVAHPLSKTVNHLNDDDTVLYFSEDALHILAAKQFKTTLADSIDPLRRPYRLQPELTADSILASNKTAKDLSIVAAHHGALFNAAELLGLSAAMIDMATAYAKERKQFGNPIGSYQAVKHHLANAFVALEFARPVLYRAAAALSADDDNAALVVAHAKITAIDAATKAAETAIQIHGGMGYTFEVDLHLWMKRVWSLSGLWGDRNYHMKAIEAALFDQSLAIGPGNNFS